MIQHEIPLIDFDFLQYVDGEVAVEFFVLLFAAVIFIAILIYKYKCRKENHRHDEAIHNSDNLKDNIRTIYTYREGAPPDGHTSIEDPVMKCRQNIAYNILNGYERRINGDLDFIRKKANSKSSKREKG